MDHSTLKSVICALSKFRGPFAASSLCGTVCRVCVAQHMPGCCGLFTVPSDQLLQMVFEKLRVAQSWFMACHISDSKCNAQTYSTIWRCQWLHSTRLGVLRLETKAREKPKGGEPGAAPVGGLGPDWYYRALIAPAQGQRGAKSPRDTESFHMTVSGL